ncbi:MAG: OmpA family protein [Myxococcales bacterium]
MVVALASDVLFASGQSKLSKDGEAAIAEVAKLLAEIPDRKFQVEGHTDNVPPKPPMTNWDLAAARSITVVRTMVEAGMPANRISAASFGEFKPAKDNDSQEGKAANRRVEIVVVPDLSSLPGFDELKRVGQ